MSQESEIRVEEATSANEDKRIWKCEEGDVANNLGNREKGSQRRQRGRDSDRS